LKRTRPLGYRKEGGTIRSKADEDEEDTGNAQVALPGDGPSERAEYLVVLTGGQMGQLFAVRASEPDVTIGRAAACEVRIQDDGVSRRQARLVREGDLVFVEDLGSRNGTYLNGKRVVGRQALSDGDRIQVGTGTLVKFTRLDEFEAGYQRRMFEAAVKDALTGAYNRRHFHERMSAELAFASRHSTPLSLLMIDIDHFKKVNDQHGHVIGDKFLQTLARRLRSIVRAEDLLARYGGEEFAILSRVDAKGALPFAERIRAQVSERSFSSHGIEMKVTVSIGLASVPAESPKQLLESADEALYRAKRAGRNRVEVAPPRKK
jgi:diguanylate cyclase (GGDEF)-like protein